MSDRGHKILKWSLLGVLLVYTAAISVWAHTESQRHVCTGIEVDVSGGVHAHMDSMIKRGICEELRNYPRRITGVPLHEINTVDIEKFLTQYNNFESVNCMVSSRGKLIVHVVPLIPVMRVFFGDNSYYINKDGKHIMSNAEFYSEVPIVTGRFNRSFPPKAIIPLINYIRKDAMLSELVSMVNAEDANNLILVPRIRGHVVNFGDTTRLDEKKEALALFYRQVMPYKGWEEYDTITVKYRGQVVATRRDKTQLNHAEEYFEEEDLEEGTLPDAPEAAGETVSESQTGQPTDEAREERGEKKKEEKSTKP